MVIYCFKLPTSLTQLNSTKGAKFNINIGYSREKSTRESEITILKTRGLNQDLDRFHSYSALKNTLSGCLESKPPERR